MDLERGENMTTYGNQDKDIELVCTRCDHNMTLFSDGSSACEAGECGCDSPSHEIANSVQRTFAPLIMYEIYDEDDPDNTPWMQVNVNQAFYDLPSDGKKSICDNMRSCLNHVG